jgi:hypothetical protein
MTCGFRVQRVVIVDKYVDGLDSRHIFDSTCLKQLSRSHFAGLLVPRYHQAPNAIIAVTFR